MKPDGTSRERFARVLEHIEWHLDERLDLEVLSSVATLSKYHFHRQFSAIFGVGVQEYVQSRRLHRAAHRLAYRTDAVADVALEAGYENPESFSRAFRKRFAQSPTEFRAHPDFSSIRTNDTITEARNQAMLQEQKLEDVRLCDSSKQSATYNIFYDDPNTTPAEEFRLDICAAIGNDTEESGTIVTKTIPAGRVAVLRHRGSNAALGEAMTFLYRDWLPQSGETLRDFPIYVQRVQFFPDVAEHEAVTDIYLPLA